MDDKPTTSLSLNGLNLDTLAGVKEAIARTVYCFRAHHLTNDSILYVKYLPMVVVRQRYRELMDDLMDLLYELINKQEAEQSNPQLDGQL